MSNRLPRLPRLPWRFRLDPETVMPEYLGGHDHADRVCVIDGVEVRICKTDRHGWSVTAKWAKRRPIAEWTPFEASWRWLTAERVERAVRGAVAAVRAARQAWVDRG